MIDPALWDEPEMRPALARRDIPAVYRRLARAGLTQREIAELTKQGQGEVSDIIHGRNQVLSYDVLVRIADGLAISRGRMGLAYDQSTSALLEPPAVEAEVSEEMKRRLLLATAASAMFDRPILGEVVLALDHGPEPTTLPARIGKADVVALRAMTERFRALGRAGYGVPDVLSAVAERAELLLQPYCDDTLKPRLLSALADLHTLAGWWQFDMLQTSRALDHYNRAVELAGEAGDALGAVLVVWHAAVIDRDQGRPDDALKLCQMAQFRLGDVRDPQVPAYQADLHVAAARAYALLDRPDHVRRELQQAADLPQHAGQYERADTDLNRGLVQLDLGRMDIAEQYATTALRTWSDEDRRGSVRARITLATTHALTGEPDAPRLAATALDAVERLSSLRTRALLAPLERALAGRKDSAYAELAQRARALRTNTA